MLSNAISIYFKVFYIVKKIIIEARVTRSISQLQHSAIFVQHHTKNKRIKYIQNWQHKSIQQFERL